MEGTVHESQFKEVSDRCLNMEHWLDGDKWDQVGKYTESDFEEDINNIHYDKTMLLAAHMGKLAEVF